MLNKPVGYVTTRVDELGRQTIYDLLSQQSASEWIFPVGRLDMDSEGLLLLTDDGEWSNLLTDPLYHVPKTYRVKLDRRPKEDELEVFRKGMLLNGQITLPAEVVSENGNWVCVTLREGRNRQIRKMFHALEYKVKRLIRISMGPVSLGNLASGEIRSLTNQEIKGWGSFYSMIKTLKILAVVLFAWSAGQATVSTWVGNGMAGYVNGTGLQGRLNEPFGIARDKNGNIYVADSKNNRIRKIDSKGNISSLAGSGVAGFRDGPADSARFSSPSNVAVDDSGNVYVADFTNQRIRKISIAGMVTTMAGSGQEGYLDGMALTARFDYPRGIVLDRMGNIYIGDSWNHRIRKMDVKSGMVSTYVGGGTAMGVQVEGGYKDASDTVARLNTPCGLSIDTSGNIYVADANNHRIRKIGTDRKVTTLGGSGMTGKVNGGFKDGTLLEARFNTPTEIYFTEKGGILVGDTFNNRVRRLLGNGDVTTVAGNGVAGRREGVDSLAQFNYTRGIAANFRGDSIFVSDFNNHSIRLISLPTVGIHFRNYLPNSSTKGFSKNPIILHFESHDQDNTQARVGRALNGESLFRQNGRFSTPVFIPTK